jgi:hypothetical protein
MSASSEYKCKWKNRYTVHNVTIQRIQTKPTAICELSLSVVNITYTLSFNIWHI